MSSSETVRVTYDDLFHFAAVSGAWLRKSKINEQTKLGYAVLKMHAQVLKAQKAFNRQLEKLQLDHCMEDPDTKALLKDEHGNYRFTRAATRELNAAAEKLRETELEVRPYKARSLPQDLNPVELLAMDGLVLDAPEDPDDGPGEAATD